MTKYIDTPAWDKTFPLSDKVTHKKVKFKTVMELNL